MKRALLLALLGAAGYLAWTMRAQEQQQQADESGGVTPFDPQDAPSSEGFFDMAETAFDQVAAIVSGPNPAASLSMSPEGRAMLKRRESLRLMRYNLDDGGWTIGYGHFESDIANVPESISIDQAEALFDKDVVERGERWVKLYVTVPLTQNQFDALVSIAYNMSPKSFKKFAASVNAGQGINDIAQASVAWVAPKFTDGIQARRNEEMQLFNGGVYA